MHLSPREPRKDTGSSWLTMVDELGRFHRWYKWADLTKPGIMETWWKDLLNNPQDDPRLHYTSALAVLGTQKQPSYGHLKLLSWYYNHVYHQSWHIGHLTQKSQDKSTCYNQGVYDRELNEIICHIWGIMELNHVTQQPPGPTSLLNPEIILPAVAFQAALGDKQGWTDESWTCTREIPRTFAHDSMEA